MNAYIGQTILVREAGVRIGFKFEKIGGEKARDTQPFGHCEAVEGVEVSAVTVG